MQLILDPVSFVEKYIFRSKTHITLGETKVFVDWQHSNIYNNVNSPKPCKHALYVYQISTRYTAKLKMADRSRSQDLEPSTSTANPSNTGHQNQPASRKEYFAKRYVSRVFLNDAIERWKHLKTQNGVKSEEEFVKFC